MCPGPEGVRLRVGRPARGSSWLPAPPRATRSAPMAWAPRAPGGLRQLALRARNRRRGRCTPRRLHVPILRIVSWGWWGCRRRRALRASREALCKACFELLPRARVGLHAARTSLPPPPPRLSGAPARWLTARGRRASGFAAAQRRRAAGAAGARGRRAVGGVCRVQRDSNGLGTWASEARGSGPLPRAGFPVNWGSI